MRTKDKECFYCERIFDCGGKSTDYCLQFKVRSGKEDDYRRWRNESKGRIRIERN